MDDYVFPAPENIQQKSLKQSSKKSEKSDSLNGKKTWIVFGSILGLAVIIGVSYYLGTKSASKKSGSDSTPTSTLTQPIFEIPTSFPTQSPIATITPTSPTPTPALKTKILSSIEELDGFRSSNNSGDNLKEIRAGKNQNFVTRGFVSFDLSEMPKYEYLEKATLKLYQSSIAGNPYSDGNLLKIDHLTYGNSLDDSDYSMPALLSNIAILSKNSKIEWKTASVTEQVKDDLANARSYSQFRIHFTTEVAGGDQTGDFAHFDSNHPPQLIVRYY